MKISRRALLSALFVLIIAIGTTLAILLAKGYRFSSRTGILSGTGIISITSIPDQASVYIDGHLTTATNTNINSLLPRTYDIKITKDGFISWEKNITVKEGLVTQIKATLFPAIPSVYPLTYNGAEQVTMSPDGQRMFFIAPSDPSEASLSATVSPTLEKSGLWVWNMNTNPIPFANGPEPHKIASLIPDLDYSQASVRWSPDSSQILVTLPSRSLLLNADQYQDTGRDITPILTPTVSGWDAEQASKDQSKLALIKSSTLRSEASGSAVLQWSTDETKLLYSKDGKTNFKVADLATNTTYAIPSSTYLSWLPDSLHLIAVDQQGNPDPGRLYPAANVSIMEFDGSNKSEVYYGNFAPGTVIPWPDSSRLVVVSTGPIPTAKIPNLFGINLK